VKTKYSFPWNRRWTNKVAEYVAMYKLKKEIRKPHKTITSNTRAQSAKQQPKKDARTFSPFPAILAEPHPPKKIKTGQQYATASLSSGPLFCPRGPQNRGLQCGSLHSPRLHARARARTAKKVRFHGVGPTQQRASG
jgi:hypothetical protein